MADLIKDTDLKVYLKISPDSAQDNELLKKLISLASAFVEDYCGRHFTENTFTEELDGNGYTEILLSEMDVKEITSLEIDGTAIDAADYELYPDEGCIKLTDGSIFAVGSHNVAIEYKAGITTVPQQIQFAVLELCARKFKEIDRNRQGVRSESFGDQSVSFSDDLITDEIKGILKKHRKQESG